MNQIDPVLQSAYNWTFTQTDDELIVNFVFPPELDIHTFRSLLSSDKISILCFIPGKLPLLAGKLEHEPAGIESEIIDSLHTVLLHIKKKSKYNWLFIINIENNESLKVDPKSAFLAFNAIDEQTEVSEEVKDRAQKLLNFSSSVGFVPAMIALANLFLQDKSTIERGLALLESAAKNYQSADACFIIACYLLDSGDKENGNRILEESLEMGYKDAALILGEILSPFSDLDGGKPKDGKKAIEMLEQCGNPESKFEIAKIYFNGCSSVPKDIEKAMDIYNQAKEEDPDLPLL